MGQETRRPIFLYTLLTWFGAAMCLTGAALIFAVSGSIGIPVGGLGAGLVAIAVVGQRRLGAGDHA